MDSYPGGGRDVVTLQILPALAVLSWCPLALKHDLCAPRLPGLGSTTCP